MTIILKNNFNFKQEEVDEANTDSWSGLNYTIDTETG